MAAAAAAAAALRKKSMTALASNGLNVRSMSHLAVTPSYYSASMAPPPPSQLQPQLPPSLPFQGSMDLMAVPKRKVTPHKRGLRNGPKNLKPVPVIVRCKSCGRVKLPHFYCCSGDRGSSGKSEETN